MNEKKESPVAAGQNTTNNIIILQNAKVKVNVMQEAALFYRENGFSVIPLKAGEKVAAFNWQEYQQKLPTEQEILAWRWDGNVAIILGKVSNNTFVFDADNEATVELLETITECKNTLKVRTRKGVHYYLRVDSDKVISSTKLYSTDKKYLLDLKAEGGYVVVPPSIVAEHSYYWINDNEDGQNENIFDRIQTLSTARAQEIWQYLRKKIISKDEEEENDIRENKNEDEEEKAVDFEKLKQVILARYNAGNRQDICMFTAGLLKKNGVDIDTAMDFIASIADEAHDEERKMRLGAVRSTYQTSKNTKGLSGLVGLGYSEDEILACFKDESKAMTKDKLPLTIARLAKALDEAYEINYDSFFVKFFVGEEELTEKLETEMHVYAEKHFKKRINSELLQDAIKMLAYQNERDRLKEYLQKCKAIWDGTNRIETFFQNVFATEDNTYTRSVARVFFLSAVARALRPGCFTKHILVVQGPQDFNKSRVMAALGGEWHREINVSVSTEKDFFMSIQGVWLVELPEMDSLRRAERNRVKAIISTPTDRFRPPYSRIMQDFKRRCVFTTTTNDLEIYDDPSGGTRFLPVEIRQKGNVGWVIQNRDQLWAEAVTRLERGESYWQLDEELAKEKQDLIARTDEWADYIEEQLRAQNTKETTILDVAALLNIDVAKLTKGDQMRIADCLQRLGWRRMTKKIDKKAKKIWIAPTE